MAIRDLNGTVALVTGASSGIGEAPARMLAGRGATVAMAARRTDRLQTLGEEIAESGGTALPVELRGGDRDAVEAGVTRLVEELGRVDVPVNNAGVILLGPMLEA